MRVAGGGIKEDGGQFSGEKTFSGEGKVVWRAPLGLRAKERGGLYLVRVGGGERE